MGRGARFLSLVLALSALVALTTPVSAESTAPSAVCLDAPAVVFFDVSGVRVVSISTIVGSEISKYIGYAGGATVNEGLLDSCKTNIISQDTSRLFTFAITAAPSGGAGSGVITGVGTDARCTTVGLTTVTCPLSAFGAANFTSDHVGEFVLTISTPGFRALNLCIEVSSSIGGGTVDPNPNCAQPAVAPTLTPTASPSVALGGSVSDAATLAYGASPTGTVTYDLYGPGDTTCSGPIVFTDTTPVASGNGDYQSSSFTPTAVGTYRWTSSYSGDANNAATSNPCSNSANQIVDVVAPLSPDATLTAACGTVTLHTSTGGFSNVSASSVPATPVPPAGLYLPCGLIGFQVGNLTAGQQVTITETVSTGATSYWKLQNGAWSQVTGATINGSTITFTITDGGAFDADGAANGVIVDPGGPGVIVSAQPIVTPPVGEPPLASPPASTGGTGTLPSSISTQPTSAQGSTTMPDTATPPAGAANPVTGAPPQFTG